MLYLRALQDRALSMALEKGQESADEMARILQEEAEKKEGDLYKVVRDRKVSDVISSTAQRRQLIESWTITDAQGQPIASGVSRLPATSDEDAESPTTQTITVQRDLLLGGKKAGLVRLFLSEPDMMRQVEDFQRGVRRNVLLGALITLVLLLAGFIYTMRVLEKTRRIHDQAERRIRLASLGALAGGLAHEIRNPLNAMSLNVQLLEEDIAASRMADQTSWRASLQTTRREIKRLDELVTNVLTYAKPSAMVTSPVALHDLARELCAFLKPDLDHRGIAVEQAIDEGIAVMADAAKLRQALLNVLRNSAQALESRSTNGSPGGGHLWISARRAGDQVEIVVDDDGPGIPETERAVLFKAFTSNKPGGTGLGLPIARRILRAHGGDLSVGPRAPRGTRVTFTLPTRS
ncbi:MAG: ATP-binding protein [Acidobacteriota bacterium]